MTSTPPPPPWPRIGPVRRYGPVLLIVVALLAAGVVATAHSQATSSAPSPTNHLSVSSARVPPTYTSAERAGDAANYRWRPGCDTSTGRLMMPTVYAPPCVPAFSGKNGGGTWNGVSATSITVAYYQAQPGGLQTAIQGATNTPAASLATARSYVDMLNHVLQLYGRTVNLVTYQATGASNDPIAAQADAVRVAQQLHAFASIGGPAQTGAYEDELARLHVMCIGCGTSSTYADFQRNAPYMWSELPTPDTLLNVAFGYLIKDLNGRPAIWAGNPAWHRRRRLFAVVNVVQSPPAPGEQRLAAQLTARVAAAHVNVAISHSLTYQLDLTTLPEQATTIAAKLKASNATTVLFAGDPVMPIYLTKACAKIGYFPEWLITGTVFTDTSTLGRYYDQAEWAHAFGISSLAVPSPIQSSDAYRLYRWWYGSGSTPPASKTAAVILPPLMQLFEGIQLAGPGLTPYTFAAGMFRAPPAGGAPTTPREAYGYQGARPAPSYSSPADYTYIWYNPSARGTDEEGVQGSGLMEYVQGGRRYPAGVFPTREVPMFSRSGAVTTYSESSPERTSPSYPAWPGSPAATR